MIPRLISTYVSAVRPLGPFNIVGPRGRCENITLKGVTFRRMCGLAYHMCIPTIARTHPSLVRSRHYSSVVCGIPYDHTCRTNHGLWTHCINGSFPVALCPHPHRTTGEASQLLVERAVAESSRKFNIVLDEVDFKSLDAMAVSLGAYPMTDRDVAKWFW